MTSLLELLTLGTRFGPFLTEHHRRAVDAAFRTEFLRRAAEEFGPRLTILPTEIRGELKAAYDEERFHGPNSAIKHRYHFEADFLRGPVRERGSLMADREDPLAFTFRDVRFTNAAAFDRERRRDEGAREELSRQLSELLPVERTIEEHWNTCAAAWAKLEVVAVESGPFSQPLPLGTALAERFASAHPASSRFLLDRARAEPPSVAAYALLAWARLSPRDPKPPPPDLLSRTEEVRVRFGCAIETLPLGRFLAGLLASPPGA